MSSKSTQSKNTTHPNKTGSVKKLKTSLSMNKFNRLKEIKSAMTEKQKRKLLIGLRKLKEIHSGNIGGTTDIINADNLVAEDAMDKSERNVVAKTWDTKGDFDSIVNQRRGIEWTPKEQQSIFNFRKAKPTQQDKYFVRYESTDEFGNNTTVVIKKLQDNGQFCWTAFTTHENAEDEAKPENEEPNLDNTPSLKELNTQPQPNKSSTPVVPQQPDDSEVTVEDSIRIVKTVPFQDDVTGSDTLADFLNSGKLGI